MNKLALTFAVTLALTAAPAQAGFEIANRNQNRSKSIQCIDAMGFEIMADNVFAALNPQVGHRKIRPEEIYYAAQWRTIRNALDPNGCVLVERFYRDPKVAYHLADRVFYALHPELNWRKIRPHEVQYAREWSIIRNALSLIPF
ncbi:MAG: hypothetical protein EBE86_018360 [Hormoscilla sp. GUM202]|nr:hypothetical protein [Hormoscilla sp. GUM202]